jgi:hypothetical protein
MKLACLTEVSSQNTDNDPGSKAEKHKFQDVRKSSFNGSFMIPVTLCIVMFA